MAKALITDRVKGKIWTPKMIIEFNANIAGGVETCFRNLPTDKMEKVIDRLKTIHEARRASEMVGTNLTTVIVDEVPE